MNIVQFLLARAVIEGNIQRSQSAFQQARDLRATQDKLDELIRIQRQAASQLEDHPPYVEPENPFKRKRKRKSERKQKNQATNKSSHKKSKDIRFSCRKCRQHLIVEAAGAGLTIACPTCKAKTKVPKG